MLWERWKAEVTGLRAGGVGFGGCRIKGPQSIPHRITPREVFGPVVPSGGLEHTKVQVVPHTSVAG